VSRWWTLLGAGISISGEYPTHITSRKLDERDKHDGCLALSDAKMKKTAGPVTESTISGISAANVDKNEAMPHLG
jgi:hypothetical protein